MGAACRTSLEHAAHFRPRMRFALVTLFLAACMSRDSGSSAPITLAVVNARIWTGDPRHPWADAIAVVGDRIAVVGTSAAVKKLARPGTRTIDAKGQMVVPGFTDAHVH